MTCIHGFLNHCPMCPRERDFAGWRPMPRVSTPPSWAGVEEFERYLSAWSPDWREDDGLNVFGRKLQKENHHG